MKWVIIDNNLKFLYFSTIIVAILSFYIFASTTTSLADAQNATNLTEIDRFFGTADTLFNQKKIWWSNQVLWQNPSDKCIRDWCSQSQRSCSMGVAKI